MIQFNSREESPCFRLYEWRREHVRTDRVPGGFVFSDGIGFSGDRDSLEIEWGHALQLKFIMPDGEPRFVIRSLTGMSGVRILPPSYSTDAGPREAVNMGNLGTKGNDRLEHDRFEAPQHNRTINVQTLSAIHRPWLEEKRARKVRTSHLKCEPSDPLFRSVCDDPAYDPFSHRIVYLERKDLTLCILDLVVPGP